jgi:hypothetical protein
MTVLQGSLLSAYCLLCSPPDLSDAVHKPKAHLDGEVDGVVITKDYWREASKRGSLY